MRDPHLIAAEARDVPGLRINLWRMMALVTFSGIVFSVLRSLEPAPTILMRILSDLIPNPWLLGILLIIPFIGAMYRRSQGEFGVIGGLLHGAGAFIATLLLWGPGRLKPMPLQFGFVAIGALIGLGEGLIVWTVGWLVGWPSRQTRWGPFGTFW
jgi:hypothetical protein